MGRVPMTGSSVPAALHKLFLGAGPAAPAPTGSRSDNELSAITGQHRTNTVGWPEVRGWPRLPACRIRTTTGRMPGLPPDHVKCLVCLYIQAASRCQSAGLSKYMSSRGGETLDTRIFLQDQLALFGEGRGI
ncbi:hypothetical protein BO70DRAFT_175560 [Aspergillus heteromorphus CBS 117.55]|uniref:Uncharacterized protein n=1 Tax=Aspergillus heteromorphus CBS 117.55 TaxID=1448321 RepID=A0A317UWU3_9EURO|nr:uncharacterized protein BO70DRAFT_175560 [Aspergillus heteromorphus CBS 117.55]PWY65976.1 hypothetical protein BO70DRAFT_175560 [Aspergillus heteromorphus CBS 117.55]